MSVERSTLGLAPAALVWALVCALVWALPARADQGGFWRDHAPLQEPRQEVGAARIGDSVYVVGGLTEPFAAKNSVEVYDVARDRWSFAPPLPVALDHMGVAALHGKLHVAGGYSGDFAPRDELWILDPAAGNWIAGADLPEPRGAGWAVAHAGKLYYFGGEGFLGTSASTFIYDPSANSWTSGADMPTAREHLTAAAHGGFVYVIGGRAAGSPRNANERYDPTQDSWQTLAPMPTARSAMATAAFGDRIHVMGGEIPMLFAVHEVYDVATNTWDCRAPMPNPRHGVAAVPLDDRLLLPGGGTVQGLEPTSAVDAYLESLVHVGPPGVGPLALRAAPNPFRSATEIRFRLSVPAVARAAVHAPSGRRVRTLLAGARLDAGPHVLSWDGRDDRGRRLSPGVYVIRLRAGEELRSAKVVRFP